MERSKFLKILGTFPLIIGNLSFINISSEKRKGMSFFNEVKIPDENRQAVYDSI